MELPKKLINTISLAEKTKINALNYRRRRRNTQVDEYVKTNNPINSEQIATIGRRHKFFIA